jgi:hypothetical protein
MYLSAGAVPKSVKKLCSKGGAEGAMRTQTTIERLSYLMVQSVRVARILWQLRGDDIRRLEGDLADRRDRYHRRTNALVLSRATAAKQAQEAAVGFCCWQIGDKVQADFSLKGEWATGEVVETDEQEGYVILDFGEELVESDSSVLSFRMWDIAAGGAAHRHFKPRWGGPRPEEHGGLEADEEGEGAPESIEALLANLHAEQDGSHARCEVCPQGQCNSDAPSLRPCKGEGCTLVICRSCATEEGCRGCEGWQQQDPLP